METDCNDQMSVRLQLQACSSKKKNYLVVHDIDPQSFLTNNLEKNSDCSTLTIFSPYNVSHLVNFFVFTSTLVGNFARGFYC